MQFCQLHHEYTGRVVRVLITSFPMKKRIQGLTFLQLDLHHPTKPLNLVLGDLKYVEGFSSHLSFV